MAKTVTIKDICPESNLPSTISIDYVERIDGKFDKQRFSCGLSKNGFICNSPNKCPIYRNAKQVIE